MTCVLQSRPTHLTHVLRPRKTRVVRLCKTRAKYDTTSDIPFLPLGTQKRLSEVNGMPLEHLLTLTFDL